MLRWRKIKIGEERRQENMNLHAESVKAGTAVPKEGGILVNILRKEPFTIDI